MLVLEKKVSFIFGCSRCVFMESEINFSSPSFVWLFNLFRRTWRSRCLKSGSHLSWWLYFGDTLYDSLMYRLIVYLMFGCV